MPRDLRSTPVYRDVEAYFRAALGPGLDRITDADDLAVQPSGGHIAFTGLRRTDLGSEEETRLCLVPTSGGGVESVTGGPHSDRMPAWSPDAEMLAFLSDRAAEGRNQLYFQAGGTGDAVAGPEVPGTIESLEWSPDGRGILLVVAGEGAEKAGALGSGPARSDAGGAPPWLPHVRSSSDEEGWRRAWIHERASDSIAPISPEGLNVWEATWFGSDRIAAIASNGPGEDRWYESRLVVVDTATGDTHDLCKSEVQLAVPAANASGGRVAVIEAVCSDRIVVAGDLILISEDGDPQRIDTAGVDVTSLSWRDDDHLLVAGLRGLQTVVGELDATSGAFSSLWVSDDTCGNRIYPRAWPLGDDGFVAVVHGYKRHPEIVSVRNKEERTIASLAHPGADYVNQIGGELSAVLWNAPDELQIEGFLCAPSGPGPHPLVLFVHGGPIGSYRNFWMMRSTLVPLLVGRGYAVLLPNPRGSSGRGQEFAGAVIGDMGGADADDCVAGIDYLVAKGLADHDRVGVMGGSYGGFMSAWLAATTDRFAAAVAISPVTDWYSQHYTSNISFFDKEFLRDDPRTAAGDYFNRSPLFKITAATAPTLVTAGEVDRCTPPGQAVEFYQALVEAGVEAELAVYPNEGHGVRNFPATIDFEARVLSWFERHMPAKG
ncbi:MAG: S9 family peptidase [Actinomycetota bacterium]